MTNIDVLIGSCDNYSYLWKNFDILFQKYWKLSTKNVLVGETINFNNPNYITVTPGVTPWGYRILKALELITSKYVFFILDDYYLTEPFTQDFINNHITILEKHNAVKIMMDIDYGKPIYHLDHIENDLYKFNIESEYLNSVQPAIWETKFLKKVLHPNFSPWDFETCGNEYTKTLNPLILLKARPKHMYFNLIRRGMMDPGWKQLFLSENLI